MRPDKRAPFILALDQGTTSSRAIVFDAAGRAVGVGQQPLPALYPRPGWVEQDPAVLWQTQRLAWEGALAAAGLAPEDIAAVGIANQRETTILWDRASGRPLHNAIVWQDRRTAEACALLEAEGWGEPVAQRTGLRLDPYFSATKIAWILDALPGAREAAARGQVCFGTVDSWLLWQLSGGRLHATDATNASRTMLWDTARLAWDADLLGRLAIPAGLLPEVRPTCGDFGRTDRAVFGAEVPIAAAAGDQQAALFGQGCWEAGGTKNTYGTGCFLLQHTGGRRPEAAGGLLATMALWDGGAPSYALEGSVFSAGAAVEWLRDMGLIRRPAECGRLAASVPDAGGVAFVPAFTGLGAPDWDPAARGAILGLTRGSGRAHLCRAVFEAIAQQSRDLCAALASQSGLPADELRVDGGLARSDLLMQMQADVLGVPVVRARQAESTAFGAALLAGRGVGIWRETAQLRPLVRAGRRFAPQGGEAERRARATQWRRAVGRSLAWARDDEGRDLPV